MPKKVRARAAQDEREAQQLQKLAMSRHGPADWVVRARLVLRSWTSQKCSDCGTIVKKSLSVRTHICTGCGVVLDRDHNAALNILHEALQYFSNGTVGHTGTSGPVPQNASGDLTSAASSKRRSGKLGR